MSPQPAEHDLEKLYHRGIDDPLSITRAEYNIIRQWPPPEEEDRICVEKTGYTREQLVAKALATPDDLTLVEAKIVHHTRGVYFDKGGSSFDSTITEDHDAESSRLRELRANAGSKIWGVASEEDKKAFLNALDRRFTIEKAEAAEQQQKVDEWFAARRLKLGTAWIRVLIKNGLLDNECWGFVIFRTGCYGTEQDESWQRFREYFDSAAKATILHYNSGPLLEPKFRALFVEREELDGASVEQLRNEFKRMRDGDMAADEQQFPKGMRTSCFLVVDKTAIECEAVKRGWVTRDPLEPPLDYQLEFGPKKDQPAVYIRAVHPDFESKKEGPMTEAGDGSTSSDDVFEQDSMAGFTGEVTMALPRVFDWLNMLCFESERGTSWEGLPMGKGWYDIFTETKDPEVWIREWAPNSMVAYKSPLLSRRKAM